MERESSEQRAKRHEESRLAKIKASDRILDLCARVDAVAGLGASAKFLAELRSKLIQRMEAHQARTRIPVKYTALEGLKNGEAIPPFYLELPLRDHLIDLISAQQARLGILPSSSASPASSPKLNAAAPAPAAVAPATVQSVVAALREIPIKNRKERQQLFEDNRDIFLSSELKVTREQALLIFAAIGDNHDRAEFYLANKKNLI